MQLKDTICALGNNIWEEIYYKREKFSSLFEPDVSSCHVFTYDHQDEDHFAKSMGIEGELG